MNILPHEENLGYKQKITKTKARGFFYNATTQTLIATEKKAQIVGQKSGC